MRSTRSRTWRRRRAENSCSRTSSCPIHRSSSTRLASRGSLRDPSASRDGDHFDGDRTEYVEGYRNQARYVTSRLTKLVDHVLAQKGADPVIVIHGDHGPGSNLRWSSAEDSDLKERLSIFAAYAFPGVPEPPLLATDTTPVTGARLLAHHYLGVAAAQLPDASYFSTWSEPYRFIPASRRRDRVVGCEAIARFRS